MAKKTLFPTTYYELSGQGEQTDSGPIEFDIKSGCSSFFNKHQSKKTDLISSAHDLILSDCLSPYEAWLSVLDYDPDYLVEMMEVSHKDALFYSRHANYSPSPETVYTFCHNLKIHPAHLQPGLDTDVDYSYHFSVLKVMTDLAGDPTTPKADKYLCIEALHAERERILSRFRIDKNVKAVQYFIKSRSGMGMDSTQAYIEADIRCGTASGYYEISRQYYDVVAGLDHYRSVLAEKISMLKKPESIKSAKAELKNFDDWYYSDYTNEYSIPDFEKLSLIEDFFEKQKAQNIIPALPDYSNIPKIN